MISYFEWEQSLPVRETSLDEHEKKKLMTRDLMKDIDQFAPMIFDVHAVDSKKSDMEISKTL